MWGDAASRGVKPVRIGVLGLQGAFTEHADALRQAFASRGVDGEVVLVRRPDELASVRGLVMPGGESTTISKLLRKFDLHEPLVRRARDEAFPVLGTCAGAILLSTQGDEQVEKTETRLLGLMDMQVDRNAFGRQRESFEAPVDVKGLDAPFPAVFIRAPAIVRTWGRCEELGRLGEAIVAARSSSEGRDEEAPHRRGLIVAARQGNLWALAFHPELTGDARLHAAFVDAVLAWGG